MARMPDGPSLITLRPRRTHGYLSRRRTVLATGLDGFVTAREEHGLFVDETRLLSRYRWLIDGRPPLDVAVSNVTQHRSLGYYIAAAPGGRRRGGARRAGEETVELRLSRAVGDGLHEDVDVTNFSRHPTAFVLALEVDADFADLQELPHPAPRPGRVVRRWHRRGELVVAWRAAHRYAHQGDRGVARVARALVLRVRHAGSTPALRAGRLTFAVRLAPHGTWHACLDVAGRIDGVLRAPADGCGAGATRAAVEPARDPLLGRAARVVTAGPPELARTLDTAVARARQDLVALRRDDDAAAPGWTVAAGVPRYMALFGRDLLVAASAAAAVVGPELMEGALRTLAARQGTAVDDWRDEQPGRILHEAHTGPRAALCFNPRARYYGSITASALYPAVVAALWRWTGDAGRVRPFLAPARRALAWLDGAACRDGFYWYRTRSTQGLRNQAWKDSGDAIVHQDGSLAEPPIALCETQANVYAAKRAFAGLLADLGDGEGAARLRAEAEALARRFDATFWLPDAGFFAMGLDGRGRPIRSAGSDPGHALAAGIVAGARARATADRLLAPDLFSGWGVRTLSAAHPAYDPHSYHRGSVWPVEQGTIARGLARYGFHAHLERLCRAQLEAAGLFDGARLPEVFGGHPRDAAHPFPAPYAWANVPQAWSASAVVALVQALLGLRADAPHGLLEVDPRLPAWLPELTLAGVRVGPASLTVRLVRTPDGSTAWQAAGEEAGVRVVHRRAPEGDARQRPPGSPVAASRVTRTTGRPHPVSARRRRARGPSSDRR
jgi:glycogen debranching enzyme